MMSTVSPPPPRLAWTVWGFGALFYLLAFYQRVAPAVMTDRLMADFALGGAVLGNLWVFYFYAYVAMQIPTGILAERIRADLQRGGQRAYARSVDPRDALPTTRQPEHALSH